MLGDQYSPYDTVDARTPREPGHAIMREDTTSGGPSSHPSSNQSSYHTLMKACKISTRHAHGCDEESNNGLGNNVDNFRKWVDVVERVVTILKTDMRDLKGKALIYDSEMAMLAESIVITNEEDNEDTTEMQQDMNVSLRTTHSRGDKTESSVPFKHRDDDTSDEIEAGYKEEDIE
ncbi:hypothetical protein KY290_005272 [Solanum tuberosum]|uniref:Integrase core domain containing protein n=1 Tax=Solanum tuberosum TaxID=4113 RepID=A0ABQ7WFS3_SOLTU|nr:hypothetical protein KY289_005666 [Solanum tuberosum]KAH0778845.1 hypothetical protein KY290_005272 [Solanum tuberosum]